MKEVISSRFLQRYLGKIVISWHSLRMQPLIAVASTLMRELSFNQKHIIIIIFAFNEFGMLLFSLIQNALEFFRSSNEMHCNSINLFIKHIITKMHFE